MKRWELGIAVGAVVAAGAVGHITGMPMRMDHGAVDRTVDRTVVVTMRDNTFDFDGATVRRGETVRLVFHNQGQSFHEAVLEETGTDSGPHSHSAHEAAVRVPPGSAAELVHRFGSEPVVVVCHLPGHSESGMRADIRPR